jgi:hypothetical protein
MARTPHASLPTTHFHKIGMNITLFLVLSSNAGTLGEGKRILIFCEQKITTSVLLGKIGRPIHRHVSRKLCRTPSTLQSVPLKQASRKIMPS